MDKIIQPCNPVVGSVKGGVATCDLQIGPRYHCILLELTLPDKNGVTYVAADFIDATTPINIKVNGKVQRQHTLAELHAIQTSFGANYGYRLLDYTGGVFTFVNGVRRGPQAGKAAMLQIPIWLAEPWRKSYAAQEAAAWPTAWDNGAVLRSLQLEIPVANTANTDVAPTITAYAITDLSVSKLYDANKNPLALITKWNRLGVPYTGAGDLYVTNLPRRDICQQISLFQEANEPVGSVKIKKDGVIIRDVTRVRNDIALFGYNFYEAGQDAARMDIPFDMSDVPSDGLNLDGAREFTLIANMTAAAAGTLTCMTLLVGNFD